MGGGFMKIEDISKLRACDLEILEGILLDEDVSAAVKIQAIQTREKILAALEAVAEPEEESAISKAIRAMKEGA